MGLTNGVSAPSSKIASRQPMKRPRDGKEFVGVLVGGYKATREEIIKEMWKRYGIRIVSHFGLEKQQDRSLFVQSNAEICVILADDIKNMLQRVMNACKAGGIETIGISRKPHTWDTTFLAAGFSNPPKWRDGFDADFASKIDLKKFEDQRKAELQDIEERPTRTAWVDPKLGTTKLAEIVPPEVVKAVAVESKPKGKGGVAKPGETVPSPPGFPAALRATRAAAGLSQGEFARRLGKQQGVVSSWERGDSVPLYEWWLKLHAMFPELPEPKGVKGQRAYEALHGKTPPKATKVPSPAPAAVPAAPAPAPTPLFVPAPEPTPVVAPAPAPARVLTGTIDEYKAALDELAVTGAALAAAQARHEEVLARVDASHRRLTGR